MGKAQGIFISYRRDTGSTMSRMIYDRLRFEKGYQCFLDVEKLHAGNFRQGIEKELAKCDIFILILSKNALNRCSDLKDNVRQEIETANRLGLTFIPVTSEDFAWPEVMPEGLEFVRDQNAIPYIQVYSESFFERLYAFIESQRSEEHPENAEMQGTAGADPEGKQTPAPAVHSSAARKDGGMKEKNAEAVPSGKPEKGIPIAVIAAGAVVAAVILIVFLFSGKKQAPVQTTAAAETATQTSAGSGGTETAAGSVAETTEDTLAFIEDSEIMFDDILDLEIQESSLAAETAEEETEEETAEEKTGEEGTAEEGAEENNDKAEGSSEVQ